MSDTTPTDPAAGAPTPPPYGESAPPAAPPAAPPVPTYGAPVPVPGVGPVGTVRSTGTCILLAIVTFGIYSLVWYFKVHEEMKKHSGAGLGGGVALLLALFVGIVSPYIASSEVGGLYERAGKPAPVSGTTGLWYFPGIFILVGPIVWFVKTNGALNEYWKSQGAAA